MVWILIVLLGASADQLVKAVVVSSLGMSDKIPVIDGFFHIVHRSNSGAAWSLFAGQSWGAAVLAGVSGVSCLVMLWFIFRHPDVRMKACLSFLCAGSLGNLVDRVRFGKVTDYLDFHFGSYVFPTFNLADILIVCSTIVLALLVAFVPGMDSLKGPQGIKEKGSPP